MCIRSASGREAGADCCLRAFLVGVGTGLPGATVLLRAPVHTILQGCQTRLHHQDHSQGSPSSGSAAKARGGSQGCFPSEDTGNAKMPEDAAPSHPQLARCSLLVTSWNQLTETFLSFPPLTLSFSFLLPRLSPLFSLHFLISLFLVFC